MRSNRPLISDFQSAAAEGRFGRIRKGCATSRKRRGRHSRLGGGLTRVRNFDELDRLRAAAADRVRTNELTTLSAELCRVDYLGGRSLGGGMSPADLKRFLSGFDPDAHTTRSRTATVDEASPKEPGREAAVLGV